MGPGLTRPSCARTWLRCSLTAWRSANVSPSVNGSTSTVGEVPQNLPSVEVSVDNEASETATVLEVRTRDEIGLLHRVTRALFEEGLDVVSARVSTLGRRGGRRLLRP